MIRAKCPIRYTVRNAKGKIEKREVPAGQCFEGQDKNHEAELVRHGAAEFVEDVEEPAAGDDDAGTGAGELPAIGDLTAAVIREHLDAAGVEYPKKASKPELYELLKKNWK